MANKIQLRRDTEANWSSVNPVLSSGEVAVSVNLSPQNFKIGDGVTAWLSLPYSLNTVQAANIDGGTPTSTYLSSQKYDGGTP